MIIPNPKRNYCLNKFYMVISTEIQQKIIQNRPKPATESLKHTERQFNRGLLFLLFASSRIKKKFIGLQKKRYNPFGKKKGCIGTGHSTFTAGEKNQFLNCSNTLGLMVSDCSYFTWMIFGAATGLFAWIIIVTYAHGEKAFENKFWFSDLYVN